MRGGPRWATFADSIGGPETAGTATGGLHYDVKMNRASLPAFLLARERRLLVELAQTLTVGSGSSASC